TVIPVLGGFAPGDTATVSSESCSTRGLFGVAEPFAVGTVDAPVTVSAMDGDGVAVRPCASVMVTVKLLSPGGVAACTDATNVNVFPLPLKLCVADPPIDERSAVTESPVLLGYR